MSPTTVAEAPPARPEPQPRLRRSRSSLFAAGEPMVWMTGGALAISLAMIRV